MATFSGGFREHTQSAHKSNGSLIIELLDATWEKFEDKKNRIYSANVYSNYKLTPQMLTDIRGILETYGFKLIETGTDRVYVFKKRDSLLVARYPKTYYIYIIEPLK